MGRETGKGILLTNIIMDIQIKMLFKIDLEISV